MIVDGNPALNVFRDWLARAGFYMGFLVTKYGDGPSFGYGPGGSFTYRWDAWQGCLRFVIGHEWSLFRWVGDNPLIFDFGRNERPSTSLASDMEKITSACFPYIHGVNSWKECEACSLDWEHFVPCWSVDNEWLCSMHKKRAEQAKRLAWGSDESGGFIYMMGNTDQGIYKIGYSKDPDRRLKEITKPPYPIHVLNKIPAQNMREGERILHRALSPSRIHGEWFELDEGWVALIKEFEWYKDKKFYANGAEIDIR